MVSHVIERCDDSNIKISINCVSCHTPHGIQVAAKQYVAWMEGEFIQDALPELSADEREMLISGICPICWNAIFPE